MTQNLLPFKVVQLKKSQKIIGYSGLLPILEFSKKLNFFKFADDQIHVRQGDQGWLDSQVFLSLLSLNIVGGESVSDIDHLEIDEGLVEVLKHCESKICGKRKVEISHRFRKGRLRFFPSDNALHNYMEHFHNEEEEYRRKAFVDRKKSFIPLPNRHLKSLNTFFKHLCHFSQKNNPVKSATLDVDAVISKSNKETAFFTYQKDKGYQPTNGYWAEQGLVVKTEFRDGNVPAGDGLFEFVKGSFSNIPQSIGTRFLRMDAAGYNFDLMEHSNKNGIGFSISASMCKRMKKEIKQHDEVSWEDISLSVDQILKKKKSEEKLEESFWQCAELDYIPDDPRGDQFRYIAVRSRIPNQGELFDTLDEEELGHKNYFKDGVKYRLRVIVSNRKDLTPQEIFHWHNKRCGYSERVHHTMKNELTGGRFPSNKFGVNAFWWTFMVITLNILELYKVLVLGKTWARRQIKALRFHLIYCAGRVEKKSRQVFIHLRRESFWTDLRYRIQRLKWVPI